MCRAQDKNLDRDANLEFIGIYRCYLTPGEYIRMPKKYVKKKTIAYLDQNGVLTSMCMYPNKWFCIKEIKNLGNTNNS